jgi:hypothetical protein
VRQRLFYLRGGGITCRHGDELTLGHSMGKPSAKAIKKCHPVGPRMTIVFALPLVDVTVIVAAHGKRPAFEAC